MSIPELPGEGVALRFKGIGVETRSCPSPAGFFSRKGLFRVLLDRPRGTASNLDKALVYGLSIHGPDSNELAF